MNFRNISKVATLFMIVMGFAFANHAEAQNKKPNIIVTISLLIGAKGTISVRRPKNSGLK